LELRHPALEPNTGIYYMPYYRDLEVGKKMGKSEDEWWRLPYSSQVTAVAQSEIKWRIEALQQWEAKKKVNQ